jgi:hypothetical protein
LRPDKKLIKTTSIRKCIKARKNKFKNFKVSSLLSPLSIKALMIKNDLKVTWQKITILFVDLSETEKLNNSMFQVKKTVRPFSRVEICIFSMWTVKFHTRWKWNSLWFRLWAEAKNLQFLLIYNNNKSNRNEERAHIFITLQQQQTDQIGFGQLKVLTSNNVKVNK